LFIKQRHLKRHSVLLLFGIFPLQPLIAPCHYVKGIVATHNTKFYSHVITAGYERLLQLKNILAKFKSRLRICQAKIKQFFA
jgi:hypothetical protein